MRRPDRKQARRMRTPASGVYCAFVRGKRSFLYTIYTYIYIYIRHNTIQRIEPNLTLFNLSYLI